MRPSSSIELHWCFIPLVIIFDVSLSILCISLHDRFEQQGVLSDIDEAIELHRAALALHSPNDSDRSWSLNDLATSLRERFKQQGALSDLDEAIDLQRAAQALCSPGHSLHSILLNNIALTLRDRYQQRGMLSDLDEAIELHRAALALRPFGHSYRSSSLSHLAISLVDRFEQRGALSDLDEAIELHRAALTLRGPGHHDRSSSLNNLAISLRDRFNQQGAQSDLNESIEHHRAALVLRPPGHSNRLVSLNNLAISLQDRFRQQGISSDLNEAIELHRESLALRSPNHTNRSSALNNLAASLRVRFEQRGVSSDLDEAIELHRAALILCPPGHYDRSSSLNNLAISLQDIFEQRGVQSNLDEAIELHRAALVLRPPGHVDHSMSLNNLASALTNRFEERSALSDLDETSVELHRAALVLRPPGHSVRSSSLNGLASSLHNRFQQQGVLYDLDESIELYRAALALRPLVSRNDFRAATSWAASAEKLNHDSALVAYQTALKFLDQHVAVLSSSSRHFDLIREATSSLAMDAFSCSVRHGALTTAVELVEQGRAVFWTQLARFRTPLDELSASGATGDTLAEEFRRLSFSLRKALDASTDDQSPQIRQLTIQWEDVISRIRMMPDFSRFLLPPLFSDLQKAAEDGPVIIVNASQYGCDALIIHIAEDPVHVPLDITRAEVSDLSSEFQSLAEKFGSSDHLHKLASILRKLWHDVVDPVVQALTESQVRRNSRIWWCPTAEFTLLPLHAAGPYEKKKENLSHIYISSYTPTLATLIRARQQVYRDVSSQHFVAIGQGNPDKGRELKCVAPELAVVSQHVAPVASFTPLADSYATVQGASDALSQTQWLHLACHGMPNRQQPFESSFAMRDGPLTIREIIRSRWHNPEFAFLSACHTTVGDKTSPDEAIHLAAAMQFSGFRSVIGSMWSVDDEVARQVVSAFYGNMVDGSGRLDCTRAAVALHKAVKIVRKKISLEQQIVFVHIGV
ncbi:TPR-like protein [Suillus lakei]|nr:TPR-like protein [Suillus lakei]